MLFRPVFVNLPHPALHLCRCKVLLPNSRLMVIMRRDELYDLHLNPECERVFQFILRNYTGIFADYEHIEESTIAFSLELTQRTVYENLLLLGRLGVIHYVPRSSTPYVMFLTSRQPESDLVFPREVYEWRREQMKQRIEAMGRFLFDGSACRNTTLLEYFGEESVCSCGKCDVCRGERKGSAVSPEYVERAVLSALRQHPAGLSPGALGAFLSVRVEVVVPAVRALADRGLVSLAPEGSVKLPD